MNSTQKSTPLYYNFYSSALPHNQIEDIEDGAFENYEAKEVSLL